MSKQMQWSKFWWGDWARDAGLRTSSYAAKGLWMDMLCHMDASEERGFLVVSGRAATPVEIARIVGGERRAVERLLAELEANNVFSRDERGAIFSRRMLRDDAVSQRNNANGLRGGNPQLLKNKELEVLPVNTPLKADKEVDKIREERTELRSGEDAVLAVTEISKPLPAKDQLWGKVQVVVDMTGKPPKACRSLIGKWLKNTKDDCARVLAVLREAEELRPIDPIAWIERALAVRMQRTDRFDQMAADLGITGSIFDDRESRVVPFPSERRFA